MSPYILLDEIELWLPTAAALGVLLLSILILICKQRRKSAKPEKESNLLTTSPAYAPSQAAVIEEIIDDPSSRKTVEEEPVTTYCNNGCQGACACPALDFQSTLPTSEPAVSAPSALIQNPSTDDGPPTDPLPEIPNFESQSSLPRKGSSKNPLQFIKDKFSRHDSLDARTEASGNERRGSKNQGGRRRWSLLGRRNSGSEKEMHLRKDETNKEVTKGESKKDVNKDGSTKEVNKGGSNEEVKNGGSNMEVNTDGGNKEVSKDGSNAEMSGIDDIRSESVHHAQRCKDSLRLLKGMMNFKRTNSTCSTAE